MSQEWENSPPAPYDLWRRPGGDGKGGGGQDQCTTGSDLAYLHLDA